MIAWAFWAAISIAGIVVLLTSLRAAPIPVRWHNDGVAARRRNLINLLGLTTSRVLIVTGRLYHDLYVDPFVMNAFRQMPRIDLTIYHERNLDLASDAFIKLIREHHNVTIATIEPGLVSHGALFDYEHGKIEARGVEDDAIDKAVEYFAYDRKAARQYESAINNALARSAELRAA